LLAEALAAARQIQNEYRAAALGALAPHLPPELQTQALTEALTAARQLPETGFLGSPRADALRDLAPHLPPELLSEALAAARQIQNEEYRRADALRALIPELGKHILLWKAFWLQLRHDLLRSRPYRMAESVVQRLSPPFPWERIASAATRPAALEEILRRAYREGNLSLTTEAVQAIQTLLESGEERNALALLRLARPEKDVPIPESWLTHPSPEIRPLAYLLRAEAGTLDTTTLEALVALLRRADDRCRYRASQVLLQQRDTSKLTPSFIEALARQAQETENEPQVGTVLDWALTNLEHDQSEWLVGWLERMENDEVARRIVTSIRNLNAACWDALFGFARRQRENSPLLEPLLEAMGRVAQAEKIPDKDVAALEAWLQAQVARTLFPNEALHVIEYLPPAETRIGYLQEVLKSAPEVRRAAGHALARQAAGLTNVQSRVTAWLREQATQALHPEERTLWAGTWLRMHVLSTSLAPESFPLHGTLEELAILADNSDEVMLDAVLYAGADTYPWSDYHERLLRVLDRILSEQMLVHFIGRMRQEIAHREWSRRRMMMACAGVVAERLPGQFAQQAGDRQLERDLLAAMNDPNSFSVRRFAFSALSHLPRVSVEVLRALPLAMRDVGKVQQDALQAVVHFRRIEGDLTAALAETLFDPSAAVAYAGAQMLEALGRSDKTTAEERRAILLALAQAVRDSRSQREVCIQDGESIRYLGQLDHLLHRALLRIAEGGRG
jgi:hypothetical protein